LVHIGEGGQDAAVLVVFRILRYFYSHDERAYENRHRLNTG
jgi:hypothetical protein